MSDMMSVKFQDLAQQIATRIDPKTTDYDIYIGLEHLDSDSLRIERRGTPADVEGEKLLVQKGDIIFGKRRVYQRKVGIADFDGICSAHAMVLRAKEDSIIKELFPFFMQSDQFMNRALQISVGSLSPTINWKTLAKQEFSVPGKKNQKEITALLWAAEDCIVRNEQFIEAAEKVKRVLMQELFSRGIGHSDFKIFDEWGEIPEDWKIKKVDEIKSKKAHAISMGPFGSNITIDNFVESGVPVLRGVNLTTYYVNHINLVFVTEDKADELIASNAVPKDIVITHRGTVGQFSIIQEKTSSFSRYVVSQSQMKMSCDESIANPFYINFYFNSPLGQVRFLKHKVHTGVPAISQPVSTLKNIKIPLPSLSEQNQIANILMRCDDTITAARKNLAAANALKMKLINKFFSGGNS